MPGFEATLAKAGLLRKTHRLYHSKRKQGTNWWDSADPEQAHGIMIPLGMWDDPGILADLGQTDTFGCPQHIYGENDLDGIGLLEGEVCHGGNSMINIMNDSRDDFLTLGLCMWKCREVDAKYIPVVNPEVSFNVNDKNGDRHAGLRFIHQHKHTTRMYNYPKWFVLPPKTMVSFARSYLAPRYMHSGTLENEEFAYGIRLEFDAEIQLGITINRKVYNNTRGRGGKYG